MEKLFLHRSIDRSFKAKCWLSPKRAIGDEKSCRRILSRISGGCVHMRVPLSNRRFNRLSSGNPFTSRQCWIKCALEPRLQASYLASFWYTGDVNGRAGSTPASKPRLSWFRSESLSNLCMLLLDPPVSTSFNAAQRIDAHLPRYAH